MQRQLAWRSHSHSIRNGVLTPSRLAHSTGDATDPYQKLEAAWLRYVGPEAISRLRSLVSHRAVITVGGHQLIGKSTLAARLSTALGGEMRSAGRMFRDEAARRGLTVAELSRNAIDSPQIDGHYTYTARHVAGCSMPASLSSLVSVEYCVVEVSGYRVQPG